MTLPQEGALSLAMVQTAPRTPRTDGSFRFPRSTTTPVWSESRPAASAAATTSSSRACCARRCPRCQATSRSAWWPRSATAPPSAGAVDVGDRIAVETMLSCRHCSPCLGWLLSPLQLAAHLFLHPALGRPGLWGSYAQYMYLDPNCVVHKVDSSLDRLDGVMFNPLGAGFRWAVEIPRRVRATRS